MTLRDIRLQTAKSNGKAKILAIKPLQRRCAFLKTRLDASLSVAIWTSGLGNATNELSSDRGPGYLFTPERGPWYWAERRPSQTNPAITRPPFDP